MKDNNTDLQKLIHQTVESIKYQGILVHKHIENEISDNNNIPPNKETEVLHSLQVISEAVKKCVRCELHVSRRNTVAGEGVENPILMIVGEAPGREEDLQGRPFVGAAGKYLDKWLQAINCSREKNVFITNTVKCRPLNNRDPLPEEYTTCNIFLARQVALLKPKCILALGRIAGRILVAKDENTSLRSMRGIQHNYNNTPVFVTYHPSAVLRNPSYRKDVWHDLQKLESFIQAYK